uniref:Uncharacterized protein n=1 Tax=Aegilops tauschii TaxID=37682 RepID=M8CEB4_AEGTA
MASEMSKDVKFFEEEVTSHPSVLEFFDLRTDAGLATKLGVQGGAQFWVMDEFMSNIWNAEEFQVATEGCFVGIEVAPVVGAGGGGGGGVREEAT